MSQIVEETADRTKWRWKWALRLVGFGLLLFLLTRQDVGQVLHLLGRASIPLVATAVLLTVPLIWLKTVRWQIILRAQGVDYGGWSAFLAYFGSLFIGFLTPGRLGEFVKAFHVQRERNTSLPLAFSSVLADRLFDLFALLSAGVLAVLSLSEVGRSAALGVVTLTSLIVVPLLLFLSPAFFSLGERWAANWGRVGRLLVGPQGWLTQIHYSLRRLGWTSLLASVLLTVLAYGIFFGQNYLLAMALALDVSFTTTLYAVALGSLITLLPISISGLGTREAVIIAYLGTAGVPPEAALGFSLLVFFTFYICGGLLGLLAWLIKPIPWSVLRRRGSTISTSVQTSIE